MRKCAATPGCGPTLRGEHIEAAAMVMEVKRREIVVRRERREGRHDLVEIHFAHQRAASTHTRSCQPARYPNSQGV